MLEKKTLHGEHGNTVFLVSLLLDKILYPLTFYSRIMTFEYERGSTMKINVYIASMQDDTSTDFLVFLKKDPRFYVVGYTNNGQECMSYIRDHKVDVLFLDALLPVYDGIEVIKKIKKDNLV